jgi:hypothetical protein
VNSETALPLKNLRPYSHQTADVSCGQPDTARALRTFRMDTKPTSPRARDRGRLLSPKADLVEERAGSTRPWSSSLCGEASGVCELPSYGLSAQDGRGLRKSGKVQAVQHVVDSARRSLPAVGHGLDGLVHAGRLQVELVDKEVVGMSGLHVPVGQDFGGKSRAG